MGEAAEAEEAGEAGEAGGKDQRVNDIGVRRCPNSPGGCYKKPFSVSGGRRGDAPEAPCVREIVVLIGLCF